MWGAFPWVPQAASLDAPPPALDAACLAVLATALVVASATDLERRVVPNGCVVAAALSGTLRAAARGELAHALAGALVVLAVMLGAALLSLRARGEPGVGGGDVKLLAAVATWVGPAAGLAVVAAACALGVLWWLAARGVSLALGRGAPRGEGIALAPAIALAALTVVLLPLWAGR